MSPGILQSAILIELFMASNVAIADAGSTDASTSCVQHYESAQRHRNAEQLLQARDDLRACSAATCPSLIQEDCNTWLLEVTEMLPTVVLSAKAADQDVFDVTVSMDGQTLTNHLDGRPIEVDPGLHTFVFEGPGRTRLTKMVIVAARQRAQDIAVLWAPPPQVSSAPTPVTGLAVDRVRPVPPLFYALAATAVVGFGGFAVLGLTGEAEKNNLQGSCSPDCSKTEVSALKTRLILSDVAVGFGGAAAAGALVVLLARPERTEARTKSAIGVRPTSAGAIAEYMGTF